MESENKVEGQTEIKQEAAQSQSTKQSTQPQATQISTDPQRKKGNLGIIIFIIAIMALAIVLVLIFTKHAPTATKEMLNITYSIELENGTLIDSGTKEFTQGEIGLMLGFKTTELDKELESERGGITGMAIGETKTITLDAKDAYGEYDNNKIYNYERVSKESRTIEFNRTNWITINDFKQAFDEEPQLDKTYEIEGAPWPYKVVDKNNSHVKLSQEPSLNQEIPFGIFTYKVIEITAEKIKLKLQGNDTTIPTENGNIEIKLTETEIITTLTPEIGQEVSLENLPKARVTGMNETHLFLDANHPYAGKKITVKLILNNIVKTTTQTTGSATKIPGAPTLQVFIMSYCPFGLQAVKGLLPVWEKFQNKANIELRFVSYTMHGQKEDEENARMICIREEQSSKLIPYLKCFVEAGDASGCIKKTGIDENKLASCMTTRASQYMEEDKALNEKYGVQGSPTFVLDGEEANIYPRDPQSIANAICNAFKGSKPNVCSESFSTQNPSPGFGSGSSSSSSGGSCG
ncbi:MAG: hypothetical protein QW625_02600 [Candidatus Nanoarchaeia archaeon]